MTAATDPVGRLARHAALLTDALSFRLLGASSAHAPRTERVENAMKAFEAWPKVCRAMGELMAAAPTSAEAGEQSDAKLREWIEERMRAK